MPWKEKDVLNLRWEFVFRAKYEGGVFRELCEEYGISPKTGYKWVERFEEGGPGALMDQSRRPRSSPDQLDEAVVCELVKLKLAHQGWGARKIQGLYQRRHSSVPSESSIKRVLERAGLVVHRRKRRVEAGGRLSLKAQAQQPNEVWTVDFKGWWHTRQRQRCEPLTIRDQFSRYVLAIQAMESTSTQGVQGQFERVFERYGLPQVIRSDNGSPFAAPRAVLGLSRLSAWWVALGIQLDRIQPGHPEQNGSHERMHLDMRRELQGRIEGDLEDHQAAFDAWRQEYNHERPHEALGMKVPAQVYVKSAIVYEAGPIELEYPESFMRRRVGGNGTIRVNQQTIPITTSLRGWDVGLKFLRDQAMEVWFERLRLGEIDLSVSAFRPTPTAA